MRAILCLEVCRKGKDRVETVLSFAAYYEAAGSIWAAEDNAPGHGISEDVLSKALLV